MQTITAKVSSKYQIVIPKDVRKVLGLQPHDTVIFLLEGDTVIMRARPDNFTEALRGLHQEVWPDDPDAWLEKERQTWEA